MTFKYSYDQEKNVVKVEEIVSEKLSEEIKIMFYSTNKVIDLTLTIIHNLDLNAILKKSFINNLECSSVLW